MSIGMRPSEGLSPTIPHQAAGMRTEPPIRCPRPAARTGGDRDRAARRAARVRSGFHGLRVWPHKGLWVQLEWANSGVVVLPTVIAPAARSRRDHRVLLGHPVGEHVRARVVRLPLVGVKSLIAIGTPCSGPTSGPDRRAASPASACSSASSG